MTSEVVELRGNADAHVQAVKRRGQFAARQSGSGLPGRRVAEVAVFEGHPPSRSVDAARLFAINVQLSIARSRVWRVSRGSQQPISRTVQKPSRAISIAVGSGQRRAEVASAGKIHSHHGAIWRFDEGATAWASSWLVVSTEKASCWQSLPVHRRSTAVRYRVVID